MPKLVFGTARDSPDSTLFRKVVDLVERDPQIQRLVRPTSLRSWKGLPEDSQEFGLGQAPALRFTPEGNPEAWYSPESQTGILVIAVEVVVAGFNVTDLLNLWWCVEKAIYPGPNEANVANANELNAAGAFSGMVEFQTPRITPIKPASGVGGGLYAESAIRLDYQKTLNV